MKRGDKPLTLLLTPELKNYNVYGRIRFLAPASKSDFYQCSIFLYCHHRRQYQITISSLLKAIKIKLLEDGK